MNEYTNEYTNGYMNEDMNKCMNGYMKEYMTEYMNEYMDEYMHGYMDDGEDPSKWYKIHGYASDTVYAQARIWYRLRATLPLVPFTCNPSVSAPPRPVRLPVSLLGCFAGVIFSMIP